MRETEKDVIITIESETPELPFQNFMQNPEEAKKCHSKCSEWYASRIAMFWKRSTADAVSAGDVQVANHRARHIMRALSQVDDVSINALHAKFEEQLSSISDTTDAEDNDCSEESQDSVPRDSQYTFRLLGLLSMLYEPKISPVAFAFEMAPQNTAGVSPRFRKQRDTTVDSIQINPTSTALSFIQLIASFGRRLPIAGSRAESSHNPSGPDYLDNISASNIYYSNLRHVGKLQIKWVHDLTQHLDLDERGRTLCIFAFPAYCTLICLSDPESTRPLSRLLPDHLNTDHDAGGDLDDHGQPFDAYCREVLVSFGIIFAQEAFSRITVRYEDRKRWREAVHRDPMLACLCTTRWQDNFLSTYLQAPPIRSNYSARADFSFLGDKLLRLEEYMNAQDPNDFYTLMFDRRDPLRFWTFVTAVSIGSISILLNLIQIILTGLQLSR